MKFLIVVFVILSVLPGWADAVPFSLECRLTSDGKFLHGKITALRTVPGNNRCRIGILPVEAGPEDAEIALGEVPLPNSGSREFQIALPDLPERTRYWCEARFYNAGGAEAGQLRRALATPPAPHWRDFTEGVPDGTVPAPWSAVELEDNRVKVWGREFVFAASPLPVQIRSQNTELLAAAARLVLEPAVTEWVLDGTGQPDATTVRFSWTGMGNGGVVCRAQTEIYFDGVMRLDVTFPEGMTVNKFALEFPVRNEVAEFLHRGPWGFGGVVTTYRVKPRTEHHPIRPQLFLFNDEVGFGWFDGMPFDWPLAAPGQALEVIPERGATLFRVNYIDQATVLTQPRTYTAGLQPIPARPLPEQELGLRMNYAIRYGDESLPAWYGTVDYDAAGNIRQEEGSAELQVQMDFDPAAHPEEELFWETNHAHLRFKFGWAPDKGIFAQIYEDYQDKVLVTTGFHPAPGEWNHYAVTWGEEVAIYINGKKAAQVPYRGSLRAFPVMIHAGGKNVAVDALKISASARTDFAVDTPAQADAATLLLDHFEASGYVNGRPASLPEVISPQAEAGYPTPDAEFGAGRWGRGVAPMRQEVRSLVAGYRHYGIDTFCFHASQYTDESFAGMYIYEPERLRQCVEEIHRHGGRAILYLNNSLSTRDRAWDAHQDDWLIKPAGAPFIQEWIPDEKGYQACPRSEYIDYFFWRLAANLDEFDLDGGFLDGRMYSECDNAEHGCGVVNFSGERVKQRDVWDGRRKAWRLYNIIESRNGYGEQHKSSIWDAPTCFFWNGAWEGEQFMLQARNGRKRTDILPLEAMQTQMNGIVYGLPARFTAYLEQPFSAVENCTYSFVHGTTWTMTYRINEAAVIAPYWRSLDEFGATYASFRPYWGKIPPAREVPDPWLKVSAYVQPERALAIIANFNEEQPNVKGKVRFAWEELGFPGPWRAYDAFSGDPVAVDAEGMVEVDVKSFRQSWIVFERK